MTEFAELLPQLRDAVKNELTEFYDNDFALLHWLNSFKGDVAKTAEALREHLQLRQVMDLDAENLRADPAKKKIMEALLPYLPKNGCEGKTDKWGNLLQIDRLGMINTEILHKVKQSDFIKFQLIAAEEGRRELLKLEKAANKPLGFIKLTDLQGLSVGSLGADVISGTFAKMTEVVEKHFPGLTAKALVVNAPSTISVVWGVLKMVLSEEVQSKVIFLNSNKEILEYFDSNQLPLAYGGSLFSKNAEFDRETMVKPPAALPDTVIPTSQDFFPAEKLADHIAPGDALIFRVNLTKDHTSQLKWYFEANGDLVFKMYFKFTENGKQSVDHLTPAFSLSTSYVPESGAISYHPEFDGTLYWKLENQAAYFLSTSVSYCVKACDMVAGKDIDVEHEMAAF